MQYRIPGWGVRASSAGARSARRAVVRITRKSIGPPPVGERGAGKGIGPGGFEPPYPDPKSGVLPLDEGPARLSRLNLAGQGQAREPPTHRLTCAELSKFPSASQSR